MGHRLTHSRGDPTLAGLIAAVRVQPERTAIDESSQLYRRQICDHAMR
jgi:hypothetical protein